MFPYVLLENTDTESPDILQFAPVNVISVEDCLDYFPHVDEQHICMRDPNGEQGPCYVSLILT